MANLVRDKKLEGIKDLADESTSDIRIVITLKNNANPQSVLNYLYKHTRLEETSHYNMVALVDGVPKTLSLKAILDEFVAHRKVVVRRRTEFDLRKAEAREHIFWVVFRDVRRPEKGGRRGIQSWWSRRKKGRKAIVEACRAPTGATIPMRSGSSRIHYENANLVIGHCRACADGKFERQRRPTLQRRYQPVWLGRPSSGGLCITALL